MIIQWSDEDQVYLVSLPEWGPYCKTHGRTYEEAAKKAHEALELLIESHDPQLEGARPKPKLFECGAMVVNLRGAGH
jgi:predicted RNase H-like HicB family nuclease